MQNISKFLYYRPMAARLDPDVAVFRALADPIRRAMLEHLRRTGEMNAGALGAPFPISQPAASQHLKILLEAGLVRTRRLGTQRLYRVNPEALRPVSAWVAPYEAAWKARLGRVARGLKRAAQGER